MGLNALSDPQELEAALNNTQQVLARAKEQVAALERFGVPLMTAVTREKLQEAHKMLQDKFIDEHDFAAVKAKYLRDSYGLATGGAGEQPPLA